MESNNVVKLLEDAAEKMREQREEAGRSETARRLAIAITELEKLIAYVRVYVHSIDAE
jgi:hypothetical protein